MGDSPATLAALGFVGLVGYLVGSISSGYIVGRIYRNVDLRTVGSGSTAQRTHSAPSAPARACSWRCSTS